MGHTGTGPHGSSNDSSGPIQSPRMQWIKCTDQLPAHAYIVLIWITKGQRCFKDLAYPDMGVYLNKGTWRDRYDDTDIQVSHWMEIAPPN